jgi:hypothetical protein
VELFFTVKRASLLRQLVSDGVAKSFIALNRDYDFLRDTQLNKNLLFFVSQGNLGQRRYRVTRSLKKIANFWKCSQNYSQITKTQIESRK